MVQSSEGVIICSFLALSVNVDVNTVKGEDQMSQYGGNKPSSLVIIGNKLILSVTDILSLCICSESQHVHFFGVFGHQPLFEPNIRAVVQHYTTNAAIVNFASTFQKFSERKRCAHLKSRSDEKTKCRAILTKCYATLNERIIFCVRQFLRLNQKEKEPQNLSSR